jgi:hypothetical protein
VGSSFAIKALVASLSFQQLGGAIVGTTRVAPYAADAIAFVAFGALLALSINRAQTNRRWSGSGSGSGTPAPIDRDRNR